MFMTQAQQEMEANLKNHYAHRHDPKPAPAYDGAFSLGDGVYLHNQRQNAERMSELEAVFKQRDSRKGGAA